MLKRAYPDIAIEFQYKNADHDRFIILKRVDGSQARILIGKGLDFIDADGRVLPTYVVVEDPVKIPQ
jgi:hypothetical protein